MKNQKSINKQQYAYQTIRERIINGTYVPGYRLILDQLAKEFSTSPIPIREAIRQLESEGLIHYKPYSGAIVTPINENEYIETLSALAVIEGYATALAAEHFPDAEIRRLTDINAQMQEALDAYDFALFGKLNRQFHGVTYDYCPNHYLVENIKQTWQRLDTIRTVGSSFIPSRSQASIEEHSEIIRLLQYGKPFDTIERYVRMHKMNTVKAFTEQRRD
ncbi:GntR family transcriptional regulator [Camelliibacillus cellulosilyticus]|uniref:GntR family transcriptional regulator n=1 Tax=Camelliibacillus cellulosilyticus TaxID=2174486 RepID=A0ABV9GK07_9BACL